MNSHLDIDPSRCAELLRGSMATVALTGAGISTRAGIPDFRGPEGLYVTRRYDPEKVFAIDWFFRDPRFFYEFSADFIGMMKRTAPTFSHRFLASLEKEGNLSGVITQNIDALHQEAGSAKVVDLHGSYRSGTCTGCGNRFQGLTYDWWDGAMRNSPRAPVALCAPCGAVLKPDIVFYGEPVSAITEAQEMVSGCDLLLVLGSSLQVMPASLLPQFTTKTTIVVNRGDVALSPAPHRHFMEADLDGYFREVASCLGMDV